MQDQEATLAIPNYISDYKSHDDNDILDLICQGDSSNDKPDDEMLLLRSTHSESKMRCVMKKLGNIPYNTFPNKIVHAVTYKPTCSISTQEKNKNLHKFANLMTDLQQK